MKTRKEKGRIIVICAYGGCTRPATHFDYISNRHLCDECQKSSDKLRKSWFHGIAREARASIALDGETYCAPLEDDDG